MSSDLPSPDRPLTIVVTGLSGFIAKHCALELLAHGYRVRGTVRNLAVTARIKQMFDKHVDTRRLEFVGADLLDDRDWDDAMQGANGVLHVASPFPLKPPKDAQDLIRPALEGTLRVLRAAKAAGVERFVQTSSTAAIAYGHGDHPADFTAADWTQVDKPEVSAYARSKTLAERGAREFVAGEGRGLHYASVNPGYVLGPLLDAKAGSSALGIARFLQGKYPGCPRLAFPVVDVRDVAKMHRLALETQAPGGGRYIAASGSASFAEMAAAIKAKLGERARKVPTRELPDALVKLLALVDPAARSIVHDLGRRPVVDTRATRQALGMESFIPMEVSAPAMAESIFQFGLA